MPKVIKVFSFVLAIFFVAPLFSQEIEICNSVNTSIAHDPVNNCYLRVSLEDPKHSCCSNMFSGNFIVYGTLISHDGNVVGEKFPISNQTCYYPHPENQPCRLKCDVGFDRENQRYLVVWPDNRNGKGELYGQFVSADGHLIGAGDSESSNFIIGRSDSDILQVDLTIDPEAQRFLAVWYFLSWPNMSSNGNIRARFVDSKRPHAPLADSKEINVSPSLNYQHEPAVTYDQHNKNFLVVWKELDVNYRDPNCVNCIFIKGQILNRSGINVGEPGFIISEGRSIIGSPEVAWENRTHRFLVVFEKKGVPYLENISLGVSFIYGRIVHPNGTLHGKLGEEGEIFVDTYAPYNDPNLDPGKAIFSPPNSIFPNVAFDPIRGDFVILFTSEPLGYTTRVDPNGVFTEGLKRIADYGFFRVGRSKHGIAYNSRCGNMMMSFCLLDSKYFPHDWFLGDSQCPGMAHVETLDFEHVLGASATVMGKVTMDSGLDVTARGMCWSTEPGPDLSGNHTIDGKGTGYFKSVLTGLLPNTKYFVRAYATNSAGTVFGEEKTFTTQPAFVVLFKAETGGSLVGDTTQEVLSGQSCSPVKAVASEGFFFIGWKGDGGFGASLENPLVVRNVTGNMNIKTRFSPIVLQGERIVARDRALKNDISEIDISCDPFDAALPLAFRLSRSIGSVGRQLIGQFSAADLADGHHHVLAEGLFGGTEYEFVVEVVNQKGEKVGESRVLVL